MRLRSSQAWLMPNEAEGRLASPRVFGVADATFGAAAASVEGFEVGDVGVGEVGDAHLVAVPVGVGEGQLGAGVGILAASDHAGALGPARQVDQVGDLGDSASSRQSLPSAVMARCERRLGRPTSSQAISAVSGCPTTIRTWRSRQAAKNPCEHPAESARAITSTSLGATGSWLSESSSTAT